MVMMELAGARQEHTLLTRARPYKRTFSNSSGSSRRPRFSGAAKLAVMVVTEVVVLVAKAVMMSVVVVDVVTETV